MAAPVSNSATATSSASGNANASESASVSTTTSSDATHRSPGCFTPSGIAEGKCYGLVRVPVQGLHLPTLDRQLVPIWGQCPADEPFHHELTYGYEDRRGLPALTLRYRTDEEDVYIEERERHSEVTVAVWDYLEECLPDLPPADVRPAIVFQHGTTLAVDVTFRPAATKAFEYARGNLVMIQVEAEPDVCDKGRNMSFELEIWSNSLDPDVLPIDILQLPRSQTKDPDLFASLQDMVSKVGKLVGAALELHGPLREDQTTIYSNVTRNYVKLSKKSMGLEHLKLLELLPTHLRWRGLRYLLQYSGRCPHDERLSKDYPLDRDHPLDDPELVGEETAETSAATASPTLDSSSSNPSDASGAANKKRKSGET